MVSPHKSRPRSRLLPVLFGLTMLATAASCTGQRPTLGPAIDASKPISRQATGVPAVDAVLLPLEATVTKTYTARYQITPTSGRRAVEAIVAQQGGQRSVTIGDIRFLTGAGDVTCNLTTKACDQGILDQRVSNIAGASSTFDRTAPATRIRLAAAAQKSTLYPSTEAFELLGTVCVNFPNGKAADSYCIVPTGQLARLERADASVTLQSLVDSADPSLFARPDK